MMHQKHTKLAKPSTGHQGRQEWAILGTVCSNIQSLASALSLLLAARWKIGYVDADHKQHDESVDKPAFALQSTDKIGFHRMDSLEIPNVWERRFSMAGMDVVLINGNHFEGARQMVALDRRKFDSLSRKLDRLTAVDAFLTKTGDADFVSKNEMPGFLKDRLPGWADIPVLDMAAPETIADFLEKALRPAAVKALILTGGKSTRMGHDKAELAYHDQPQWQYLKQIVEKNGVEAFISCRAEQTGLFGGERIIADTFIDLGPFGAILSAFRHDPDAAWLVLACDLPLLDESTLTYLLEHRKPSSAATAFRQVPALPGLADSAAGETGFPEPLITIWEPKSYGRLLQFLAQGVSCPRKVLINSDTCLLDAPHPEALLNVNTPEEKAAVLERFFVRH